MSLCTMLKSLSVIVCLGGVAASISTAAFAAKPKDLKADELFQLTKVWNVHLTFTPDQWDVMEPKGETGPFGGFRGRGGGRGAFGPAMILAPAFLEQGDGNKDGKLSASEFHALAERWFTEWDKEKTGKLNSEQLRAGLNVALGPSVGGGPGGRALAMGAPGGERRRNGISGASGIDFKYVHAELDFDGRRFTNVAVRYKGNGTWMQSRGSIKHSLKIDLNKYAHGQKLAGVSTLDLHNNVTDASWMNEVLSHRLFRDSGVPASRSAYARVYVTVPGTYDKKYFGLYSLVENPDNNFAQERFGSKKGAIFKPVTREPFTYWGDDWRRYEQTYDPKTELTQQQKQRVLDFSKLVSQADDKEFAARLPEFLDLDEFARFMAVTAWVCTLDSILAIGQNYVVYLDAAAQKFQFIPWDLDHSFGQFGMMAAQDQREQLSIHKPWQGENRFLERIFKVDAFKKLYLARMSEFSKTIFKPERLQKQVDEVAAAIRPAVQDESEDKLARFDQVVAGEPASPGGFGGFGGRGSSKPIKSFVVARAKSVNDQLTGKSQGEELGGFGFGARGGGPGRGGGFGRGGGPGGRGGPGGFFGDSFVAALDANKDNAVTRAEFIRGFDKWFASWNTDKSGFLTEEQLRDGITQDLIPFRDGPFGGPRGGPPPP